MFSVLVTKRVYKEAIDFLQQHAEVDYVSTDDGLSPSELILRARGKQAVISHLTDMFSADVLSRPEGVRVISNVGVGFDNIDIAVATERGILVATTPGVNTDTTADLAFALLLAAARRIAEADAFAHSGKWKRGSIDMLAGLDVHGRTLGILGMGRIVQAVARRGAGFDMRVLYHNAAPVDFPSRGPVVDEAALAKAQIHPELLKCENAVLTPHIGSASIETRRKMSMMAAENAVAALKGEQSPNLVNPGVYHV